ncbi:MAG TPA: uroporphyrinogen-III C-methyltransferase [Burkholderiaceae bacterium]|nr:uroporphyrinogen-III C-methyltransferase [Burkholderiaceae bacterium]
MAEEPLQPLPTPVPGAAESPLAAPPAFEVNHRALFWVALIALAVAVFAAGYSFRQLNNVKRESARRLAELQQAVTTANDTANRADAEARAARQQAGVVEARLAEEQGQREALEQLYSDLSRGRDDAVLVEVERLITVAAQELQLSGNVATALAALQTADVRLSRSDNARFVPLRRVLARDIERLKAAPAVDFTGIALKLDQLASSVDSWPLLAAVAVASPTPPATVSDAMPPASGWWQRQWRALQGELGEYRDLIRIRHVDSPESVLLDAQQQTLVRQQLRLRLLNARQALLARNDRLFRADLAEAQVLMARYIDTRSLNAAGALALIKQLASTALSVELPTIGDSMAAIRAVRVTPLAPGR